MIVILNGALGAGKSATAECLVLRLGPAALVDLDALAVRPRDVADPAQTRATFRTARALVAHHVTQGIEHFVLDSVFESPEELSHLRVLLGELVLPVIAYRLLCSPGELERRIRRRAAARPAGEAELAGELRRGAELAALQERAARRGDLGIPLESDERTPAELAGAILAELRRPVELCAWDPAWPEQFERERARLAGALGERALGIEHVGSTSIPGIAAKPVIDILLRVRDLDLVPHLQGPLAQLGYTFVDHPDNVDRRLFHVQVVCALRRSLLAASERRPELRFRDALRADAGLRDAYEALKRELARRFPDDVFKYADGKSAFVASVLTRVETPARERG